MSYSDDETNRILINLEKKINKEYAAAYSEMKETADAYFSTLEERVKKEYAAYKDGKYTDIQFANWYNAQIKRGNRYREMQDQLAEKMTRSNEIAAAYINKTTPKVYVNNYNYSAYQIEGTYAGASFTLMDEKTVQELLTGSNHSEFRAAWKEHPPFRKVSINPDLDYEWNKDLIDSALTSGIMQGKSIDKLSESFLTVMKRNKTAAVRNARTAVTSAQNAGRQRSYEDAADMGIEIQKEWMATHDKRTRDSHQRIDGEVVGYKDTFSNGLEYPADPQGPPEEVYNCRCTMVSVLPKYGNTKRMKYGEWKKEKG